jgi:hypothetical protein
MSKRRLTVGWHSAPALRAFLIGLALLAATKCDAQDNSDAATLRLADGTVRVGALQSLSATEVRLGEKGASIPVADVVRLDYRGHAFRPPQRAALVQLVNGDRIAAGMIQMSGESVVAVWKSYSDWPAVGIPVEAISGILMTAPAGALERSRWFAQVFGRGAKSDVVLLQNGDRAAGDLLSFDQVNLKLSQGGKPLLIEMARIRGIALNSSLVSRVTEKKPRIHVSLTDGSQLTGWSASIGRSGRLRFTTSFGVPLDIPIAAVFSIRFLDGRTTYLSDLAPREARVAGFFGASDSVPFEKDRNVLGGPLAVQGTEYPKGLGTRSRSRIEYELDGTFRRFEATVAIDDLAQGKGSLRFVVECDGKPVFKSRLLTGADGPLEIGPLEVSGTRRLSLVVDYGELADINDWADWCDAVVIR